MKKMMLVLSLFVSLSVFSQSEKYSFEDLVGTWRNKKGTGLDIVDSNTVYIVNGNQRKLASASLSDFSKNPYWFNLSVKDSSRVVKLKSLLMLIKDDMLQWQVFDADTKPVSFRYDKSDMIFLRKIEVMNN